MTTKPAKSVIPAEVYAVELTSAKGEKMRFEMGHWPTKAEVTEWRKKWARVDVALPPSK